MAKRIRYVDGHPVETNRPDDPDFTVVSWDQMKAWKYHLPRASQGWLVYLLLIHLAQRYGTRTVWVTAADYRRVGLTKDTFHKHVNALEDGEVISVVREEGRRSAITLSELIPLREKGTPKKRRSRK